MKNSKGTVVAEAIRGRLRLRWSYQGKRHYLYLELPDSATNRKVAEAKARLIESHLATGTFDPSLARYRLEGSKQQSIGGCDLFDQFITHKQKHLYPQSLIKYRGLQGYLQQFFKAKLASQITEDAAERFAEWLGKKIAPVTLRERISLLSACWDWALKKRWVVENP